MKNDLVHHKKSYAALTDEEKAKIEKIKNRINTTDSNAVIQYGVGIQSKISDFADSILSEVRTKDAGHLGEALGQLMANVKELNVDGLAKNKSGILSKLPFVGSMVDTAERFMTKYQSVSVNITKLVDELENARVQLLNDVKMLDRFYAKNEDYYKEINFFIMAGELKLKELENDTLPPMKIQAEQSQDPLEIQKYRDMVQLTGRLEKKVHDLKLSRTVAQQAAPQIRLVQHNNQELASKVQTSILNTIPLWKNQMVIAITLLRQKQVLDLQKDVSKTTNELLTKNAEMLKTGTVETAREAERGIVDIETLKKVNAELLSTIDETLKIHQEGKARRREAERELERLERELKEKLLSLKTSRAKGTDLPGKG